MCLNKEIIFCSKFIHVFFFLLEAFLILAFQTLITIEILFLYIMWEKKNLVLLVLKTENYWSLTIHCIISFPYWFYYIPTVGVLCIYRCIPFQCVNILFKIFAPEFISEIDMWFSSLKVFLSDLFVFSWWLQI